jgi:hypothetical protein
VGHETPRKLKGRDILENARREGVIILKLIFNKRVGMREFD